MGFGAALQQTVSKRRVTWAPRTLSSPHREVLGPFEVCIPVEGPSPLAQLPPYSVRQQAGREGMQKGFGMGMLDLGSSLVTGVLLES